MPETPLTVYPSLRVRYKNYRGEIKTYTIQVNGIRYGTSEYYPEPGYLLSVHDMERGVSREFAVANLLPPE